MWLVKILLKLGFFSSLVCLVLVLVLGLWVICYSRFCWVMGRRLMVFMVFLVCV